MSFLGVLLYTLLPSHTFTLEAIAAECVWVSKPFFLLPSLLPICTYFSTGSRVCLGVQTPISHSLWCSQFATRLPTNHRPNIHQILTQHSITFLHESSFFNIKARSENVLFFEGEVGICALYYTWQETRSWEVSRNRDGTSFHPKSVKFTKKHILMDVEQTYHHRQICIGKTTELNLVEDPFYKSDHRWSPLQWRFPLLTYVWMPKFRLISVIIPNTVSMSKICIS